MDQSQFIEARTAELERVTRRELIAQLACLDTAELLPVGAVARLQSRVASASRTDLLDVAGEISELADLAVRLVFEADATTAAKHLFGACRVANELHKICYFGGLVPVRELPYPDGHSETP